MKKRVAALFLAAVMVVSVTACGNSSTEESATPSESTEEATTETGDNATAESDGGAASTGEKVLSVQIGPNPETLDPALNSAVDGGNMILHTFECLLTVDQDGKLAPGQAESWDV